MLTLTPLKAINIRTHDLETLQLSLRFNFNSQNQKKFPTTKKPLYTTLYYTTVCLIPANTA